MLGEICSLYRFVAIDENEIRETQVRYNRSFLRAVFMMGKENGLHTFTHVTWSARWMILIVLDSIIRLLS